MFSVLSDIYSVFLFKEEEKKSTKLQTRAFLPILLNLIKFTLLLWERRNRRFIQGRFTCAGSNGNEILTDQKFFWWLFALFAREFLIKYEKCCEKLTSQNNSLGIRFSIRWSVHKREIISLKFQSHFIYDTNYEWELKHQLPECILF